jgi:hypothetical protein
MEYRIIHDKAAIAAFCLSSIIQKRIYLNTCRFRNLNIIAPKAQVTSSPSIV